MGRKSVGQMVLDLGLEGHQALAAAVICQAIWMHDADFFADHDGWLTFWCDVLDGDLARLQRMTSRKWDGAKQRRSRNGACGSLS